MPIDRLEDGVSYFPGPTRSKINEVIDAVNTLTGEAAPGQVAVDSTATPDYLGSDAAEGALRVSAPISRTDAGDYVTLGIAADAIKDTHIDFGTGANQVSAADIPIADTGSNFTATNVETALAELADTPPAAGSDTEVQINNGGVLGASEYFTFDVDTTRLEVGDGAEDTSHAFRGENLSIQRTNSYGSLVAARVSDDAIITDDIIGQLVAWAQETAWATPLPVGGVRLVAAEDFVDGTNLGSHAEVLTTPVGSATPAVAARFASDKTAYVYGTAESQVSGATGRLRGVYSHASAILSSSIIASFEGGGRIAGALGTGAGMYAVASQDWNIGVAQGCGLQFKVVANGGTSQLTALEITQGRAVHAYAAFLTYGNTTLGDASTDLITCNGRLNPRLCASDPLHATAGSRPAGTVGEIARYGGDFYICRNASTPEWSRIGGTKSTSFACFGATTDVAVGDGVYAFRVPSDMNGMNLISVGAGVVTAGTTGTTDIQLRRLRDTAGTPRTRTAADMLSTKLTIDSAEVCSTTAATAAVINSSNDDVVTGDMILVDVDAVSSTAPKGLSVSLVFALPTI